MNLNICWCSHSCFFFFFFIVWDRGRSEDIFVYLKIASCCLVNILLWFYELHASVLFESWIFFCALLKVICQFLQSQNIQKSLKVIRYTLKIPLLALIHKKTIILDIYIDTLILVANVKHQNSLLQILVSINSNFAFWNSLDHKTSSALLLSIS